MGAVFLGRGTGGIAEGVLAGELRGRTGFGRLNWRIFMGEEEIDGGMAN